MHYHVALPDGVCTLDGSAERADFHRLPKLDVIDLQTLALNLQMRAAAWLRRRGLLRDEADDAPVDQTPRAALDACLESSLGTGELTTLPANRPARRHPTTKRRSRPNRSAVPVTRTDSTCTPGLLLTMHRHEFAARAATGPGPSSCAERSPSTSRPARAAAAACVCSLWSTKRRASHAFSAIWASPPSRRRELRLETRPFGRAAPGAGVTTTSCTN